MKDKADKKRALVQFLKYNAGLKPSRVDKKVQIFSVEDAVNVLCSDTYRKSLKGGKHVKRPNLPPIETKEDALEWLSALQTSDYLTIVNEIPSVRRASWYKSASVAFQPIPIASSFIWTESTTRPYQRFCRTRTVVLLSALLALYILRDDLRNIPWRFRVYSQDLATDIITTIFQLTVFDILIFLVLAPFILLIVRSILFMATHVFCSRGLWLFPNLLTADTFLGPFFPIYDWDENPQEPLGLRWRRFQNMMLKEVGIAVPEPRRNKKRKVNLTTIRSQINSKRGMKNL